MQKGIIMQTVVIAILAVVLLAGGFFLGSSGKVDCSTAEFSPDASTKDKELCRNEKALVVVPTKKLSIVKEAKL